MTDREDSSSKDSYPEDANFRRRGVRILLEVGHAFMYFWIAIAVVLLALSVWVAFVADPATMSPDSLNRNSTLAEKAAVLGFEAFLLAFGVAWLFLTRRLRRRIG